MVPVNVSLLEFTTSTLLVAESKTSTVLLSGEIAISPGEVPAAISGACGSVSLNESMITSPERAPGPETLCDAKTRVVSLLGGSVSFGPLLQEPKAKLAAVSAADSRAVFFKRRAP